MSGRTPHVEKEEPVKVEEAPQKLMKTKQSFHQLKENPTNYRSAGSSIFRKNDGRWICN